MTQSKIKVAVIGASGYTGGELLRLLSGHPQIAIALTVSSEKSAGRAVTDLFPNLTSVLSCSLESLESYSANGAPYALVYGGMHPKLCRPR